MSDEKKKYAPLLPYDVTIKDDFSSYDRTEYQNNRDMTVPHLKKKETGNVVKFFSVNTSDEPVKIEYDNSEDRK